MKISLGAKQSSVFITFIILILVVWTAASLVEQNELLVDVNGDNNTFSIEVAGSADPAWNPATGPWYKGGNSEAVISPYGKLPELGPGMSLNAKIAVRNVSPSLPGKFEISASNSKHEQGNHAVDLFSEMTLRISSVGVVVFDGPMTEAIGIDIGSIAPPEILVLDAIVSLPSSLDNSFMGARANVYFHINGESQ